MATNNDVIAAIAGLTKAVEALVAQQTVATAPVAPEAPARTRKARQPKAAPAASKALTKRTREAYVAACEAEGYEVSGWSTWDLAYWSVSLGYAPKGFYVGERYTELALEAGA